MNSSSILTATTADQLASLAYKIGRNIEKTCQIMTETQKQERRNVHILRTISHGLQTVFEKGRQYTDKI